MNVIDSVYKYIDSQPSSEAFIVSDFIDLGNYETIKKSLIRLEKKRILRRVLRGVYDKPTYSEIIQEYSAPSPSKVALALARNFNWNIIPSGEVSLNLLGISTQVPTKFIYNSSGPYKSYNMGNITIEFKHKSMKVIAGKSYMSALVIQALKALGKDSINASIIRNIRNRLSEDDKFKLLEEGKQAPIWMYPYLKRICQGKNDV
jgi:hypothetical protein